MAASLFRYRDGQLYCEEVPVERIAAELGTPVYVYSLNTALANLRQLQQAFPADRAQVCYALKANSNVELVRALAQHGAGADIVSGGELAIALEAKVQPDRIVFAGVGKTETEIRFALTSGVLALNVESLQELDLINEIARETGLRARVSLRLNPNVDIKGHPYLTTGRKIDKFGIGLDQVDEAVRLIRRSERLDLVGLHCHVGSQIQTPEPYFAALETMLDLYHSLAEQGFEIEHLDIGGGIGVNYDVVLEEEGDCFALDPTELSEVVLGKTSGAVDKILLEPGRAVVANAGALVCRVLYTKRTGGHEFVIVDGAMNDFIRPALYGARHRIQPLSATTEETRTVDVVGPVCESGDFFAHGAELPPVRRGDYLAVMGAGAYGYVLASNYNARPRPPEVLVDGDRFWVSRPRETQIWGVGLG